MKKILYTFLVLILAPSLLCAAATAIPRGDGSTVTIGDQWDVVDANFTDHEGRIVTNATGTDEIVYAPTDIALCSSITNGICFDTATLLVWRWNGTAAVSDTVVSTEVEAFLNAVNGDLLTTIGAQPSDADLTAIAALDCSDGQIAKKVAGVWACAADATAAGAGYVSTAPTYSDEACTAGQYAFADATTGRLCISSGDWDSFAIVDWTSIADRTPTGFTGVFLADINIALSATDVTAGETYTVAGVDAGTVISTTAGAKYQIDAAAWTATAGTVSVGDVVGYRQDLASASNSTETIDSLTIGTETVQYSITTVAAGGGLLNDANMIGAWYFDNDATDASTNSNDLTNNGTATYVTTSPTPAQGTHSAHLVPTSDQSFSSSSANFNITGSFTAGGWFYSEQLSAPNAMMGKHGGSGQYGWVLKQSNTPFAGAINIGVSPNGSTWNSDVTAAAVLELDTWVHVVLVYDGSALRLYKNGTEITTAPFPMTYSSGINVSSADFYIGSLSTSNSDEWQGNVDETALFDRAISASEVLGWYNDGL